MAILGDIHPRMSINSGSVQRRNLDSLSLIIPDDSRIVAKGIEDMNGFTYPILSRQ